MHLFDFVFLYRFDYTVKKQGLLGGGTRSVKFANSNTTAATVTFVH